MEIEDWWGWISPVFLWAFDHYGFLFAFILFSLQAMFQIYRLIKLKRG